MVEEDARAGVNAVCLAIFLYDPESIELGYGVRRIGMERGLFALGNFLHFAIEFGGGGLVETAAVGQAAQADSLEQPQHSDGVDVRGIFRRVE